MQIPPALVPLSSVLHVIYQLKHGCGRLSETHFCCRVDPVSETRLSARPLPSGASLLQDGDRFVIKRPLCHARGT